MRTNSSAPEKDLINDVDCRLLERNNPIAISNLITKLLIMKKSSFAGCDKESITLNQTINAYMI